MTGSWPPGRPRVLVTDAWLANAGDGMIAIAVDRIVRTLAPHAAIVHAAYHLDPVRDAFPDLRFAPPLSTLVGVEGAPSAPTGWDDPTGLQFVRDADIVVSQGGGFLLEHYQPWERLFALSEVVSLGRPLVILGQSVGQFRAARARALLRHILRGARHVTVRDDDSRAAVLDLGADPSRVTLASDLSLTLFDQAPAKAKGDEDAGVAVVLTAHEHADQTAAERAELASEVLGEVVKRVSGEPVTLASTVQGLGRYGLEDDALTAAAALSALPPDLRSRVHLVEGYVGPTEAIALYRSQRAVVSQRLHPMLVAVSQGVPAALLLSANKAGVLSGGGVERFVCRQPTNAAARRRALDAVLNRKAVSGAELWAKLDPLRQRAALNVQVLSTVLTELNLP